MLLLLFHCCFDAKNDGHLRLKILSEAHSKKCFVKDCLFVGWLVVVVAAVVVDTVGAVDVVGIAVLLVLLVLSKKCFVKEI